MGEGGPRPLGEFLGTTTLSQLTPPLARAGGLLWGTALALSFSPRVSHSSPRSHGTHLSLFETTLRLGEVKSLLYGHTDSEWGGGGPNPSLPECKACTALSCRQSRLPPAVDCQALRSIPGLCLSTEQSGVPRISGAEPHRCWVSLRSRGLS